MMDWIALIGRLLLAVAFLLAAVGKMADRRGSRQALADFGVPNVIAGPAARILPLAELAIAALLVPNISARWGALAALVLLALFIAAMLVNLARGRRPDCHCFGQLHSAPVGTSTVVRNGALAAVATVVLWRGGEAVDMSAIAAGAGLGTAAWVVLVVAIISLALAGIETWLLLHLLPRQGQLLARVESLEAALGQARVTGLPVGSQAPEFELRSVAREKLSLTALRSAGRPVLLFFTNPDCEPCDALLPEVARWQRGQSDRVEIALISRGSIERNRAKAEQHGLRAVLVQKTREVSEAYLVDGTPAAVLVSPDGRIAAPLGYGAPGVEELLQQAIGGVAPAQPVEPVPSSTGGNGHREPSAPLGPPIGQPAPAFARPDLDGRMIDLVAFSGAATLVLFWSPDCGFCQQMLPELKAWERKRRDGSPRLLIVSSGTAEANRAMGLTSPIVLDADGTLTRDFGVRGTPMAVLVDKGGRIASSVAVGAEQVLALARTPGSEAVMA